MSLSALPWDEQQPVSYFENKDKRGSWHGEDRFPWLDCCRVIDPSNGRLATAACFGGSTRVSRREWRHRGTSRLTPQRQRVAVPVHARPGSLCTERRHVDAVAGQTLYECVCVEMTAHTHFSLVLGFNDRLHMPDVSFRLTLGSHGCFYFSRWIIRMVATFTYTYLHTKIKTDYLVITVPVSGWDVSGSKLNILSSKFGLTSRVEPLKICPSCRVFPVRSDWLMHMGEQDVSDLPSKNEPRKNHKVT